MLNIPILQSMCEEPITRVTELLAQQFAGWRSDYLGMPEGVQETESDLLEAGHYAQMHIFTEIQNARLGNQFEVWQRLAQLLSYHECLSWCAIDFASKTRWNPLLQTYAIFKAEFPESEPYLATEAIALTHQKLLVQFFEQHGQPF